MWQDAGLGSLTVTEEDRQGAGEPLQHGGRGYVQSHISIYQPCIPLNGGEYRNTHNYCISFITSFIIQNWRLNASSRLLVMFGELYTEGSVLQLWMMNVQHEATPISDICCISMARHWCFRTWCPTMMV